MAKAPTSGDREWQPINAAPFDRDLELAVINYHATHALVFPCRRILGGWIKTETKERIDVQPTHWREWTQSVLTFCFSLGWIFARGEFCFFFGQ